MATEEVKAKNKKIIKRLSDRETVYFVELYEAEEVLWNVRHENYKNKDARDSAVGRIVQKLGIPGFNAEHVLKKINNIRSTYLQEINKIKSSTTTGCSPESIYEPKVSWFDIAHRFLPGVMKTRTTFTNLNLNADQEAPVEYHEENTEPGLNPVDANNQEPQLAFDSNTTSFNVKSPPTTTSFNVKSPPTTTSFNVKSPPTTTSFNVKSPVTTTSFNVKSHPTTSNNSKDLNKVSPAIHDAYSATERQLPQNMRGKKRKLDYSKVPDHITKAVDTLKSIKDDVSQMENQDEFSHFAKNVACQLRELPTIDALKCQSEILQLIQEKRIENLQRQQYLSILSPTSQTIFDENTEYVIISSDGDSAHIPENSVEVSSQRPDLDIIKEAVKHSGVLSMDK